MKTLRIAIIGLAAFALAGMASAQTLFWDADGGGGGTGGSGNWNTTDSTWRDGGIGGALQAWVNNRNAALPGGGLAVLTLTEDITVGSNGTSTVLFTGTWDSTISNVEGSTTSGKTLTLNATGVPDGQRTAIGDNGGLLFTINCPVILAADDNTKHVFAIAAIINGNISESSVGRRIVNQSATLTLNGSNSFSGGINTWQTFTKLVLGHDNAAGTGPIRIGQNGGGKIEAGNGDRVINNVLNPDAFTAWNNYIGVTGTNKITFTQQYAAYTSGGNARVEVDTGAQVVFKNFQLNGYGAAPGVIKEGGGTMILDGFSQPAAGYGPGGLTVDNGTLLVNTTTPSLLNVTVANTGTLGGTGTITLASGKTNTVNTGGALAPGAAASNSVGTLTIAGAVTLAEGAVYKWEYQDGAGDLVALTGAAGTLTLPTVATVQVSQVSGDFQGPSPLFTATTLAGATDLSQWVVTGLPKSQVERDGTSVVLFLPPPKGTVIVVR